MIEGVYITPLKIIKVTGGDVYHAMKNTDVGYTGFGEAYFSTIEYNAIKAWKRHKKMTLNLVVPVGAIRFVICMDDSYTSDRMFETFVISNENYCRLTVPPNLWLGFQCISKSTAILLNIADTPHDPNEVERKSLNDIKFDWST